LGKLTKSIHACVRVFIKPNFDTRQHEMALRHANSTKKMFLKKCHAEGKTVLCA